MNQTRLRTNPSTVHPYTVPFTKCPGSYYSFLLCRLGTERLTSPTVHSCCEVKRDDKCESALRAGPGRWHLRNGRDHCASAPLASHTRGRLLARCFFCSYWPTHGSLYAPQRKEPCGCCSQSDAQHTGNAFYGFTKEMNETPAEKGQVLPISAVPVPSTEQELKSVC